MFTAVNTIGVSSYFPLNFQKPFYASRYFFRCSATQDSTVSLTSKVGVNGILSDVKEAIEQAFEDEKLEPLWDDGYGSETVQDYTDYAKDFIKPDGGPPRWFTPLSCGPHLKNSPVLLFLPGVGGSGLGLILQHKALGKVFDVRCMHIPVQDRTPFEELIEWIEESVRAEHFSSPSKPIYLVGDSFGGCLALSVAARNPKVDLVLILANPATSFGRLQLQPLLPVLEALPADLYTTVPYLLSLMGEPLKLATVNINDLLSPAQYLDRLADNFNRLLSRLSEKPETLPKESLLWKLKLLKTAASYVNSRLHAVRAEVLVLASGKDNLLPSRDEALRLMSLIRNCKMRYFKDNGHSILLEEGVNLLTIIKSTRTYRRSRTRDYVTDYLLPSASEFKQVTGNGSPFSWFRNLAAPVMFSTMEDGSVVRGLSGVPDEGPVLLIGYHKLVGIEIAPLLEQFLREKKIMVRGIAHPIFFSEGIEDPNHEPSIGDLFSLYGTLPVNAVIMSKLFDTKCHVLLYPGGIREAFHRKGEDYKLFWPEQPEFVRMAAKFGAAIVPFGAVGEDDLAELVLDYDDLMRIPIIGDQIKQYNEKYSYLNVRGGTSGEVTNQPLHIPGIVPKVPGRLYYLFGKPISMKGRNDVLKDKGKAKELYIQIKEEVESCLSYLIKKRKEDPYRNAVDRTVYRAFRAPIDNVPSFEP